MTEPAGPPPPAPERRPASRALLAAVAAAVLLIGALLGVALDRAALHSHRGAHGRFGGRGFLGGEPGRLDDRIARDLGLTAAQRSRIDSILARRIRDIEQVRQEVRPRMRQIFTQTRAEIDSVLTPDQRERMHARFPPGGRGPRGPEGEPPGDAPGDPAPAAAPPT